MSAVIAAQAERLILWVPFFLAVGIGAYFALSVEPPLVFSLVCASVLCAPAVLFLPWRQAQDFRRVLWMICVALALAAIGFACSSFRACEVASPMLERETGPVMVGGLIENIENLGPKGGSRLILRDVTIENLPQEKTPGKVRLTVRKDENLRMGDRISVLANLHPPSPPVAPGAFDFQRYAFFHRIGGLGFAFQQPQVTQHESPDFLKAAETLRLRIVKRIEAVLPERQAAMLSAIVLGERAAITEEDWDAMRDAGLAHILAISGMNIGVVAGLLFFISRLLMAAIPPLALRWPVKKTAAVIALGGALFYTILVGAPVPIQRSMLMTAVVLIAVLFERWPFSLRLLALAATAILLVTPENLVMASFQMSFAAVTGLICFYEATEGFWRNWHREAGPLRRLALYVLGVCATTVVATLCTAPFSLYHFQQIAVYGVLANALAVPLLAFVIMPAAIAGFLLMPLGLEGIFLKVAGLGVSWMLETAWWTAGLRGAALHMAGWPVAAFVLMVAGGFFLLVWRGPGKWAGLLPLAAAALLIAGDRPPDILISPGGKLVAFRDDAGAVHVSDRRAERFTLENWMQYYGREGAVPERWPSEGSGGVAGLACDAGGCRLTQGGVRIAFIREPYALREDCGWADLVISIRPVEEQSCVGIARVIDRFDVWRNGAYGVWLVDGRIKVENANGVRGARLWTVSPGRRRGEKENRATGTE